jgi:hypothetical protein
MLHYLIPILGLAALCGGFVWLQIWIRRHDPDSRSILERGCHGRGDGSCGKDDCSGARCKTPGP